MYTNNTRWRYTGGQEDRHAWVGTRVFHGWRICSRSVHSRDSWTLQAMPLICGPSRSEFVTDCHRTRGSLMDFVWIRSVHEFQSYFSFVHFFEKFLKVDKEGWVNPSDRYSLSRIRVLIFRDYIYIFRNNIFVTLICL